MSSKTKTAVTQEEATHALVPKLRFPEFRGAAGWVQMRLIDTADHSVKWSFIGGPFGSNLKSSDYVPDGVRIIQLQNIGDGEFFNEYQIFTTPQKADELLSNNIYPGEIIMSKMGDPVGRACLIPEDHDRYVMCSDGIRLVVDEKENDKYFIYSLINSPLFRAVVEKTATGSTRKRIGLDELKSLPMWLPKKSEQQKIAECLGSVDELMAAQARKVAALKTYKNGLVQQLFPGDGETKPKLRFPEFQNAGKWSEMRLGDIGRVIRGASPRPKGDPRYYGGPVPRLMVQDVTRDGKWVTPRIDSLTTAGAKLSRPCKAGTLTIVCSGTVGVVSFLAVDACIHDGFLALIEIDESKATRDFLYHSLSTLRLQFEEGATHGGVFTNLTTSGIQQFEVKCPKPPEQQRIAACLSGLDDLITSETQKLEALKAHKRALMQQMFPTPND